MLELRWSLGIGTRDVTHTVEFEVHAVEQVQHSDLASQMLILQLPGIGNTPQTQSELSDWHAELRYPDGTITPIKVTSSRILGYAFDNCWYIPILKLLTLGLGKDRVDQISSLPDGMVLKGRITLEAKNVVHGAFERNEYCYLLHKVANDSSVRHVSLKADLRLSMNWWRRNISPWFAILRYGRKRRYDFGGLQGWSYDYMAGTVNTTYGVTNQFPLVVPLHYRRAKVPHPFGLVVRLVQFVFRLSSGST